MSRETIIETVKPSLRVRGILIPGEVIVGQPITETAHTVTETIEPITETSQPITETSQPTTEAARDAQENA